MGGNALKNTVTRRYEADEYHKLEVKVVDDLKRLFPQSQVLPIKAYKNKSSFGDMDILIDSEFLPSDYQQQIKNLYDCHEMVKNGNCLSFSYHEFQIDLIITDPSEMVTSYNYFNYNDLSNLVGRVARKLDLKYGHDGLSYDFREGTEQFRNVVLLTDLDEILKVLGYDPRIYHNGFNDLEDIFRFVVSSPYFSKDIFALENRNHAARVRDSKRKTYTEFLKWLETYEEPKDSKLFSSGILLLKAKGTFHNYLFEQIPHFAAIYETTMNEWKEAKKFKSLYNGEVVMGVTGLSGKELGMFMKYVKEYFGDGLQTMINTVNPDCIESFVAHMYKRYTNNLDQSGFDPDNLVFAK